MTRTTSPEPKTRIRQSPLPIIGAVVAIILVVFYGWSQRGWLANVADIESRDVDMQSQQLQRGFATELDDLYAAMGDYAIWNETAEFDRISSPSRSMQARWCDSTSTLSSCSIAISKPAHHSRWMRTPRRNTKSHPIPNCWR